MWVMYVFPRRGCSIRWLRVEHCDGIVYSILIPGSVKTSLILWKAHRSTKSRKMLNRQSDSRPPWRHPESVSKTLWDDWIAAVVPIYIHFSNLVKSGEFVLYSTILNNTSLSIQSYAALRSIKQQCSSSEELSIIFFDTDTASFVDLLAQKPNCEGSSIASYVGFNLTSRKEKGIWRHPDWITLSGLKNKNYKD